MGERVTPNLEALCQLAKRARNQTLCVGDLSAARRLVVHTGHPVGGRRGTQLGVKLAPIVPTAIVRSRDSLVKLNQRVSRETYPNCFANAAADNGVLGPSCGTPSLPASK
jgi:hypothetical protein